MTPTIGFYSHVNTKFKATECSIASIRKFYPDAPIAISCDNAHDYSPLIDKYNIYYHHNNTTLGYPVQPFGYRVDKVLEFLDRMYRGVLLLKTDYFVMMEDDVLVVNPIQIDPNWDMAGQPMLYEGQVPIMPEAFLDIVEKFSGVRPNRNYYNCGGGSIFKTDVFINNYYRIRNFLKENTTKIQDEIYPTLGWMDCFMCVFYYLCGKQFNENHRLHNNYPFKKPFDFSVVNENIDLIHSFKDHYDDQNAGTFVINTENS